MAGDWIQMRHDLPDDPAVIGIAERTGLDEDAVIGRLHRIWTWADKQTLDGNAPSVTLAWLDRYARRDGFGAAMVAVGWLEIVELDGESGLRIPKFDEYISESAKKRALTARRAKKNRAKSNAYRNAYRNADSVTKSAPKNAYRNADSVTKSAPKEEKRREENNTPIVPFEFPESLKRFSTADVQDAAHAWLCQLAAKRKPSTDPHQTILAAVQGYRTPGDFCAAVWKAIGSNWGSLQPADPVADAGANEPPAPTGPIKKIAPLKPRFPPGYKPPQTEAAAEGQP